MRFVTILILVLSQLFISNCQSQESKDTAKVTTKIKIADEILNDSILKEKNDEINLLFMGDIMGHDLQIESAYNPKTKNYDFSTEFEHIVPLVKDVDAAVGNLEVTLAGPPYKGYPQFSSPDQLAIDIKNAGIKYLGTANNHINDRGLTGFNRTMDVLDSLGFVHTGTFRNQEDKS
ncbi:MAG: CapA family protein [Chloroflexia bacterium]|nr:CapA family protein [Chloroflexia bacterium]